MSIKMNINGKLEQISGQLYHADIFPGQITMGANLLAPYGWLKCDGASYLKTDYPDLYAAIGDTYNQPGIEAGKFSVPDMRNQFAMGAGDKAVGTKVEAGLPNLVGFFKGKSLNGALLGGSSFDGICSEGQPSQPSSVWGKTPEFGKSQDIRGVKIDASKGGKDPVYGKSDTVQPPAVVLNFFIKY